MRSKFIYNWRQNPLWLRFLVIGLITLGIFFRLVNLDHKVYWHDETLTSLRVFGYTETELVRDIQQGEVRSITQLQQYQHPSSEKNFGNTLKALAEHPEHPPLYYLLARFWAEIFGSSVAAMRSLPAATSLLSLVVMYWLNRELFRSPLFAWLAVSILAISGVHILYAQEARQYSLWTLTTLLSSASLLRAMRLKTRQSWCLYAMSVAAVLYTHLLGVFVLLGQGIYCLIPRGIRYWQILKNYLLAALGGCFLFSPWLVIIVVNLTKFSHTTSGTRNALPISTLLDRWFRNFTRVFFNADLAGLNFIMVAFSLFSIYYAWRSMPPNSRNFVITLIAVPALGLILPDFVLAGRSSTTLRYLLPTTLGMHIAAAYWLGNEVMIAQIWRRKFAQVLLSIFIIVAIVSSGESVEDKVRWNKGSRSGYYPKVAQILNQSSTRLVLYDGNVIEILGMSHLLDDHVQLQFIARTEQDIPETLQQAFFLDHLPALPQQYFERQGYGREKLYERDNQLILWKLESKAN